MDLFTPIIEAGARLKASGGDGGPPGDGSKTLDAEAAADLLPAGTDQALPAGADKALPASVDQATLTDAARAILGIGSGESSSD